MAECPECRGRVVVGPASLRRKGMFSCESCGAWLMPTNISGILLIGGVVIVPAAMIIASEGAKPTPLQVLISIGWVASWITLWWNKMAKFVVYNKPG